VSEAAAAEPFRRDEYARIGLIAAEVAGVVLLVRAFGIENQAVYRLLLFTLGAFVVHALLPMRYRLGFFALVSMASVVVILGPRAGAAVLGAGATLIAVCHLPVAFRWRVALLLAIAAALMLVRSGRLVHGIPGRVWPVLASMFMFRIALYLHAARHDDAPRGAVWGAAYFFMLPNVCFPLYPVVDYRTFTRTAFDAERFAIYERGVELMLRGLLHLVLYQLVTFDLAINGLYVNDLAQLVQYLVATFLLYLRVSGQFHLIVGVLHLFGFRLPDTHHLYYLASSFTDFWRRINIYWKDFMMKLVYYPSFFRLRRVGNTVALAGGTIVVFVATWLLHAYQFYWIRGESLFNARDAAFWGVFAVLVVLATLREARAPRRTARTDRSWSARRALQTVGTFVAIVVLWSVWNAETWSNWAYRWSRAAYSTPATWLALAGLIAAGIAVAGYGWGAPTLAAPRTSPLPWRGTLINAGRRVALIAALLAVSVPAVQQRLPWRARSLVQHAQGIGDPLVRVGLDVAGYYEALNDPAKESPYTPWRPIVPTVIVESTPLYVPRQDFLLHDMAPNVSILFHGARFTTNSWGFRGHEYALEHPEHTFRIAVMGPSQTMGWGVADDETYSALLERRLDSAAERASSRVEVLNFGAHGEPLIRAVDRFAAEALRFRPDLVVFTVHAEDLSLMQLTMRRTARADGSAVVADSSIVRLMAGVGVTPTDAGDLRELRPIEEQIAVRALMRAKTLASSIQARVVVLGIRSPGQRSSGNLATTERAAASQGLPFIDCGGAWDGAPQDQFRLSRTDAHPNPAGHRRLEECLGAGLIGLGVVPGRTVANLEHGEQ